MKKGLLLLCLFFILVGCAETKYALEKQGSTEAQRKKDLYECKIEAINASKRDCSAYGGLALAICEGGAEDMKDKLIKECLDVRGYAVKSSNEYEPQPQ